jgi:serpin B
MVACSIVRNFRLRAPKGFRREALKDAMTLRRSKWMLVAALTAVVPLGATQAYRAGCSVAPEVKSDMPLEAHPDVTPGDSATLVAVNTQFALDAYRELVAENPGQNLVWSPHSVAVALAMAYAGAGGQTATEMAAALHWALPPPKLHAAFDALDQSLASRAHGAVALRLASSLWALPGLRFERPFLDTLARDYGTGVRLADFVHEPERSSRRINAWVDDATQGAIRQLVSPIDLQGATFAIVQAVSFHGEWSMPFHADQTSQDPFTRLDGNRVDVQMMHAAELPVARASGDAFDAVELPYAGGDLVLDIVMPKASLPAFESEMTALKLGGILDSLEKGPVRLSVPRLRLGGATFALEGLLRKLGVRRAFDPSEADFSPMARAASLLCLQRVLHQCTLEVDEKGTEAAAATIVIGGVTAAPIPHEDLAIAIDHPFFFAVRDVPTDTILFMGRVVDPTR